MLTDSHMEPTRKTEHSAPDDEPQLQRNGTIMVVDDDEDIRDAITEALFAEGFAVISASNGREALELLHRYGPPSFILLDLMMPVMDGWEFIEEKRKDPLIAHVPVAVLSAVSMQAPPAETVLMKPVSIEQLRRAIEQLRKAA